MSEAGCSVDTAYRNVYEPRRCISARPGHLLWLEQLQGRLTCVDGCQKCAQVLNLLKPNDHYSGRTAPLTSKRCILYIYSTNIGTEYFKNGIYSPIFSLQNAICFIILTYLVPVLFTFYIFIQQI